MTIAEQYNDQNNNFEKYGSIKNPETNRMVKINSRKGKEVIQKYIKFICYSGIGATSKNGNHKKTDFLKIMNKSKSKKNCMKHFNKIKNKCNLLEYLEWSGAEPGLCEQLGGKRNSLRKNIRDII